MTLAMSARSQIRLILEPKHPLRPFRMVTLIITTYWSVDPVVGPVFQHRLTIILPSLHSRCSQDNAYQHAPVPESHTPVLCMRMGRLLAARLLKSTFSRPLSINSVDRSPSPLNGRHLMYVYLPKDRARIVDITMNLGPICMG